MAPLLRTRPGKRTGIAGNNQRLSHRGGHRGLISRRIYSWAPTKPAAYRVKSARYNQGLRVVRREDHSSQGFQTSRLGLTGTVLYGIIPCGMASHNNELWYDGMLERVG